MAGSKRLPHGARWHALSSQKRPLMSCVKLTVVCAVLGYFFWNVSVLSGFMERSGGGGNPAFRTDANYDTATAADSSEVVPGSHYNPTDVKRPWFLNPETFSKKSGCDFSSAVALFKPEELEINCGNVDQLPEGEFIGQGFWRQVYKTTWNGRPVAVKRVKPELMSRPDIIPRHVEECAAIFSIRDAPNIVRLVGWCETTVVVDYIPHQLDELLFRSPEPVPVRRALELARDAARGVAQLHQAAGGPFVHADLQARQFLIDANGTLKLNDFNRVKYTGPKLVDGKPTTEHCTFRTAVSKGKWRSPEEYLHLQMTEKLDVYSLSLVLWSMRARTKPFHMLQRDEVYKQVPKGVRPLLSEMSDYPQEMQDLIVRGWDTDPSIRPSAQEMADEIDAILRKYDEKR